MKQEKQVGVLKQCYVCKREGKGPKAIHFFSKREWNRNKDHSRLCSEHSLENSRREALFNWTKRKGRAVGYAEPFVINPERVFLGRKNEEA